MRSPTRALGPSASSANESEGVGGDDGDAEEGEDGGEGGGVGAAAFMGPWFERPAGVPWGANDTR